ncbi:MAG: AmmeMemoRadiSam system radical SAM enzyme [Deltaproteobacteria bacterium]|nr:AmmeMemoRadiSam system radical SAM enzyme [Deltaproteobacteria bacterium]
MTTWVESDLKTEKEAMLYDKGDDGLVSCRLCGHLCRIKPAKRGKCGVRENDQGTLRSLVYARAIARHVDPIEKKPIFHLAPGSRSYSIATVGCNFKCSFCQNADISQLPIDHRTIMGEPFPPEQVVAAARAANCRSISYTYTEPTIFFEYAYDTAKLAQTQGLLNIFVTNGYMTADALETIHPYLDAANVDLKSFRDEFYKEQCGAKLSVVLDTLKMMKKLGIWVEVTTLLVTGLNDSAEEMQDIAAFLMDLGPETPWHISRFHPTYRLTDRGPTPVAVIQRARDIGLKAGLRYVYTGNVVGDDGEKTYCYNCGHLLIDRVGYSISKYDVAAAQCSRCRAEINGIEM